MDLVVLLFVSAGADFKPPVLSGKPGCGETTAKIYSWPTRSDENIHTKTHIYTDTNYRTENKAVVRATVVGKFTKPTQASKGTGHACSLYHALKQR